MRSRILHVMDHTESGGAQVAVEYLIRSLQDQFSFGVAVLGKSGHYSEAYRSLGAPVHELGLSRKRWSPAPTLPLIRLIRREGYELIHTHLFRSAVLGAAAAGWTGRKVILHDHSDTYSATLKHRPAFSRALLRNAYLTAYRRALGRCDRAIVLTQATCEAYRRSFSLDPAKVIVLPNGVNVKELSAVTRRTQPGYLHAELGLPADARLVLMVGRLEAEKDWWTFVEVARRVRKVMPSPCTFVAAGSGSEDAQLRALARDADPDGVVFLGHRDDVPALLSQADVFLLTSRRESFGIAVLEAMAVGCPVVATRSGGPDGIITHGVDGLLASVGDVQQLADHVLHLLADDALGRQLARSAQRTVSHRYTIEVVCARMASVYREVLSQ
jgi:glycosyltransferase involved in cell wall biosynthesis